VITRCRKRLGKKGPAIRHERVEKCFPDYFQRFTLPPEAREQALTVYRACRTRKVDEGSFLNSYEESGCPPVDPESEEPVDPSNYSLSTYTDQRQLKRFVAASAKIQPPLTLAVGTTEGCCGPCSPTAVWRTSPGPFQNDQARKSKHVDWWLYKGARPWEHFEEIAYEEA